MLRCGEVSRPEAKVLQPQAEHLTATKAGQPPARSPDGLLDRTG